jgi:hypothetical protein
MEEPGLASSLPPIFLLHLEQVGELAFQVIPQRPALVVQTRGICTSIKGLNPPEDVLLQVPVSFPNVGSPALEELPQTSGNVLPGINGIEEGAP